VLMINDTQIPQENLTLNSMHLIDWWLIGLQRIIKDSPPKASPMHCNPMHTPNTGTVGPSSKTVCKDMPESWGSPVRMKKATLEVLLCLVHWSCLRFFVIVFV
jgi:hypothetical protein